MNTIRKLAARLKAHLSYWPEAYIGIPLTIALLTGSLRYYRWVTGRDVIEDVATIPAALVNLVIVVVCAGVAALLQKFCLNYRSEEGDPSKLAFVLDAAVFFLSWWTTLAAAFTALSFLG